MLGSLLAAQKINCRHAQGWHKPRDGGFGQTFCCSLNGEEGAKWPAHGLPFSARRGGNHSNCPETGISSPEGGCGEAERRIRDFFCSLCMHLLSLLPPFVSPCSRLEIEFDASFDRLVLCAETRELCCNVKPFSIKVSGKTGCLLLFLFSFQKPL